MEHLSETLQAFIFASFETMDQLHVLLLLQANSERGWNAIAVSSMLHLQLEVVRRSLHVLHHKGFLRHFDATDDQYRYQPADIEQVQMVHTVAELDRTRPVTLIKLIYARSK